MDRIFVTSNRTALVPASDREEAVARYLSRINSSNEQSGVAESYHVEVRYHTIGAVPRLRYRLFVVRHGEAYALMECFEPLNIVERIAYAMYTLNNLRH